MPEQTRRSFGTEVMHLVIAMDLFSHNILNYELLTVRREISRRRGTIKLANLGVMQKIVSKEFGMLANIVAFILHAFNFLLHLSVMKKIPIS